MKNDWRIATVKIVRQDNAFRARLEIFTVHRPISVNVDHVLRIFRPASK